MTFPANGALMATPAHVRVHTPAPHAALRTARHPVVPFVHFDFNR
ncbi:MAG TPA: hypothetical protein VFK13_09655 [Gemmatimonadaceae bacterium]|nr:hypothetical protein [Gemmatimonadaceae bacterium]